MKIRVGDTVETIDDAIKATVIKVKDDTIIIEDSDGFEFDFFANELIKLNTDESINLSSLFFNSFEEILDISMGNRRSEEKLG